MVFNIISKYRINSCLGYFVLDNVSSNNITINLIFKTLYPQMTVKQWKCYCIWCLSYIVNLAAQAFLLSKTVETTLKKLKLVYNKQDFNAIVAI